jgi:chromosome segregation ATPase
MADLQTEINMKEQREKERLLPEIERMNSLISEINSEILSTDTSIQKEEK